MKLARELCTSLSLPAAMPDDVFGDHTLQAFIARTERVQNTAERRVIQEETVPNSDKLFRRLTCQEVNVPSTINL